MEKEEEDQSQAKMLKEMHCSINNNDEESDAGEEVLEEEEEGITNTQRYEHNHQLKNRLIANAQADHSDNQAVDKHEQEEEEEVVEAEEALSMVQEHGKLSNQEIMISGMINMHKVEDEEVGDKSAHIVIESGEKNDFMAEHREHHPSLETQDDPKG